MAKPNIQKRVLALSFASLMLVSGCSVGIGSNNIVAGGQKAHSDSQQGSYKSCLQGATEGGKTAGDLGDQNHLSGRSEELSDEQNKVAQTRFCRTKPWAIRKRASYRCLGRTR